MPAATTYLLDTNNISCTMKDGQGQDAQRYRMRILHEPDCKAVTSVVVQSELLFGQPRTPSTRLQSAYERQMEQLPVLPLEDTVGSHYATLRAQLQRAGTCVGAKDTLIAAHVLALCTTLVTVDAAFSRVPDLQVENWLQATF